MISARQPQPNAPKHVVYWSAAFNARTWASEALNTTYLPMHLPNLRMRELLYHFVTFGTFIATV
jgi:hypothetical protein